MTWAAVAMLAVGGVMFACMLIVAVLIEFERRPHRRDRTDWSRIPLRAARVKPTLLLTDDDRTWLTRHGWKP